MSMLLISTILTELFFIAAFILAIKLYGLSMAWQGAWRSYIVALGLCMIRTIYNISYLMGALPYILNIVILINVGIALSVMTFTWYLWRIFSIHLTGNSWKK